MQALSNFKEWWKRTVAENASVHAEATMDSLARFKIMAPIIFLVNCAYIYGFWFHDVDKLEGARIQWANYVGWSHFLMLCAVVVLGPLVWREVGKKEHGKYWPAILQIIYCVSVLAFGIGLTISDQLIGTNTTNFAMICLIVGMTSLMRPTITIGLFIVAFVGIFTTIGITQTNIDNLNLTRSHTVSATLMTIVASLIVWRQYVTSVLLRRKVIERSAQLREKTNDILNMLQNMPQGILTIVGGDKIHPEYSAYLEQIFETKSIANGSVMNLVFTNTNLGADTLSQVEATMFSCIGEDRMNFEFNSHALVTELDKTMPDGRVKSLELSWSPICDQNDTIDKLMLCVRDVTELKKLTAEAGKQKRELDIIGQILAVNQEKFSEFVDGSTKFIVENEQIIKQAKEQHKDKPEAEVITQLFRNMHTIKGNARTYGLLHLTNLVHEAEQTYDELRKAPEATMDHDKLLDQLSQTFAAIQEYAKINEVKLGRKGPGRRGSVDKYFMIPVDQVNHIITILDKEEPNSVTEAKHVINKVRANIHLFGTDKIQDILTGVTGSLPSLAEELGKEVPSIVINDNNVMVRSQISDLLRNVFMHLYRNSLDHGIETADKRVAEAKPAAGTIALNVSLDQDRLWFKLNDDGRGLALDFIKKKAIENGVIGESDTLTQQEIAQLIFASGFSTAEKVTEVSGRGVGMDAVKSFVEREGGTIELVLQGTKAANGFCPFETVISLPAKFAVQRIDTLQTA